MAANMKRYESGSAGGTLTAWPPPVQTQEELELVKRYVILGIVMLVLDHDIRAVGLSRMKFPRSYESLLRGIQDRVLLDLAGIKRQFRAAGIKLHEERREKDGLHAQYLCRGYEHRFSLLWSYVRKETERLLKQYMSVKS